MILKRGASYEQCKFDRGSLLYRWRDRPRIFGSFIKHMIIVE